MYTKFVKSNLLQTEDLAHFSKEKKELVYVLNDK